MVADLWVACSVEGYLWVRDVEFSHQGDIGLQQTGIRHSVIVDLSPAGDIRNSVVERPGHIPGTPELVSEDLCYVHSRFPPPLAVRRTRPSTPATWALVSTETTA